MNEWLTQQAYNFATKHFAKWYGFFASLFILVIALLGIYKTLLSEYLSFFWCVVTILVFASLFLFYWLIFRFHYPQRSRDRLGLVIGVRAENPEEQKYLDADFLTPLKARIQRGGLPFDVLPLKQHQSESIVADEDARKVLKKTKAQFILWGSVKKRKEKYFFELRGMVVHAPIQEAQRILLISEFDLLLPNTVAFEEAFQPENFGFRAEQSYTSIDYITGRAALLSGDPDTAIKLHEPLFQDTEKGLTLPIPQERLKRLLSIEYDLKAAREMAQGLPEHKSSVENALKYSPNNYGSLLKKAIIQFDNGNGDVLAALETVKLARHAAAGGEWNYSMTFLYFWMGDYDKALKSCDNLRGKKYACDERTPAEVIVFNENLLKNHNKPALYYWLGFVAFEKEKNPSLADTYFQKFIDNADSTMGSLVVKAKEYLEKIRATINY